MNGERGPGERRTRASRNRRSGGISPRTLWLALAAVVIVALAILAWWVMQRGRDEGVDLAGFPEGSTATVSYAGSLPAAGTLSAPKGVAVRDGRLYVAVAEAGAIRASRLDGSRPETIALPAASEGVPSYPVDVAPLPEGRLAVVDTAGTRVLLLSSAGSVEATLGPEVKAPTAVAFGDGRLYVADGHDHVIDVFSESGSFERTIGARLDPALTFVGGVSYVRGRLYVSDSANARVILLDAATGELAATVQRGFDLPRGVAVWPDGALVSDVFGRVVVVLDEAGVETDLIPPSGSSVSFVAPEDVAFDEASGRAYVSDSTLGRIFVFNVRSAEDARGGE